MVVVATRIGATFSSTGCGGVFKSSRLASGSMRGFDSYAFVRIEELVRLSRQGLNPTE